MEPAPDAATGLRPAHGSHVIAKKGACAARPAVDSRGHSAAQIRRARQYAHLAPTQALAQMEIDGVPLAELPSHRLLGSARRTFLEGQREGPAGVVHMEDYLPSWLDFLQKERHDGWEYRPTQFPGLGIFINRACMDDLKRLCDAAASHPRDGSEVYVVQDATYKLNRSGWPLYGLGVAYLNANQGEVSSSVSLLCVGFIPKEATETLVPILTLAKAVAAEHGLDLRPRHVHGDCHGAMREASDLVWPEALFRRDLRHTLEAVDQHEGPKLLRKWLRREVSFMAATLSHNDFLFHEYTAAFLSKLEERDPEGKVYRYAAGYIFQRTEHGMWTAEWRSAVNLTSWEHDRASQCRPGFTTSSLSQALESYWSKLKHEPRLRLMPVRCNPASGALGSIADSGRSRLTEANFAS